MPIIFALLFLLASPPQARANAAEDYKLGCYYRLHAKRMQALQLFNKAISEDPNFAEAYLMRIEFYCNIDQAAKNLADCNKVMSLDPTGKRFPDVYLNRAMAYAQLEDNEKVLADCNKAEALGCANKTTLHELRFSALRELDQPNEAIKDLDALLDNQPTRGGTDKLLRARAELYEAINKPDKALVDLYKALAINPKYDECYEQLARVHEHMGQPAKALEDFAARIKLNPRDEAAYLDRGHLNLKMGRYADAASDLSKCIDIDPNLTSKAYQYRAEAYTKLGKKDLAARDTAALIKMKQ